VGAEEGGESAQRVAWIDAPPAFELILKSCVHFLDMLTGPARPSKEITRKVGQASAPASWLVCPVFWLFAQDCIPFSVPRLAIRRHGQEPGRSESRGAADIRRS